MAHSGMNSRWKYRMAAMVAMSCSSIVAQGYQTPASDPLQAQLQAIAQEHHGKVALFATQLNTGKTVALDQDAVVQTASDIKLAILYHAMVEVREGRAKWDEKLTLKPGDPVGGSGMLHFFDTPLTVTLKD